MADAVKPNSSRPSAPMMAGGRWAVAVTCGIAVRCGRYRGAAWAGGVRERALGETNVVGFWGSGKSDLDHAASLYSEFSDDGHEHTF